MGHKLNGRANIKHKNRAKSVDSKFNHIENVETLNNAKILTSKNKSTFFPCFLRNESLDEEGESSNNLDVMNEANLILRNETLNNFSSNNDNFYASTSMDLNQLNNANLVLQKAKDLRQKFWASKMETKTAIFRSRARAKTTNLPSSSSEQNFIEQRQRSITSNDGQTNNNATKPTTVLTTEDTKSKDKLDDMIKKYAIHSIIEYTNMLVPNMVNITNAPYYWGRIDRYEAEKLLENKPEGKNILTHFFTIQGTFILRDSAQINYLFSISFRRYERTLHARIEHLNGRFSFDINDKTVFSSDSITKLIENYKDPTRCLFFEPQLSTPLSRNFVFSLQQICRSVIASHCNYGSVSMLPIPPGLKKFLREYHFKEPVRVTEHE